MLLTSSENREPLRAALSAVEQLRRQQQQQQQQQPQQQQQQQRYDKSKTLDLCHADVTPELADAVLDLAEERRRAFCGVGSSPHSAKRRKRNPVAPTPWHRISFDNCRGTDARRLLAEIVRRDLCRQLFVRCAEEGSVGVYAELNEALPLGNLNELLLMPGTIGAGQAVELARVLTACAAERERRPGFLEKIGLFELEVAREPGAESAVRELARGIAGCPASLSVAFGTARGDELANSVLEALTRSPKNLRSLQVRTLTASSPSQVIRSGRGHHPSLLRALPTLPIRELDVSWLEVASEDEQDGAAANDDNDSNNNNNNEAGRGQANVQNPGGNGVAVPDGGDNLIGDYMDVDPHHRAAAAARVDEDDDEDAGSARASWSAVWMDALERSRTLRSAHVDGAALSPKLIRNCRLHHGGEFDGPSALWPRALARTNALKFRIGKTKDDDVNDDATGRAEVMYHYLRRHPDVAMNRNLRR